MPLKRWLPWFALTLAGLLGLLLFTAVRPTAAEDERCFSASGFCISGEVRQLWERGGGLRVFGYPLTPLQEELVEGRPTLVQWFERTRIEVHPDQPPPYRLQLGRLGAETLGRAGTISAYSGPETPRPDCRFFPETGRNLCGELLEAWRGAGLSLDGKRAVSEVESLALFGMPLTAAREETLADGRAYTVQWFERARLELHPELPAGSRVLLGLLGAELGPRPSAEAQKGLERPARVTIPAIGLDMPLVAVGLDAGNAPIVPRHDIGWYSYSAAPGAGENIVLWAHSLRWRDAPQIPAPFGMVKHLRPGDQITITTRGGAAHTYVVRSQTWALPDDVQHILPQGREQLTLVSCIGDKVVEGSERLNMTHRLITVADPVR